MFDFQTLLRRNPFTVKRLLYNSEVERYSVKLLRVLYSFKSNNKDNTTTYLLL